MNRPIGTLLASGVLLAFAVPSGSAHAQSATQAEDLTPGQYRWIETPQLLKASAEATPVRIVVSIQDQQAQVWQGERLVGVSTVSTGSPGYDTPTGEFTILQKKVFHRSNLYDDAPMPFMQRLTWDGVALHAGSIPGYPASHGCIRLPKAFARQLYELTQMGGQVRIIDEPLAEAAPDALAPPLLSTNTVDLGATSYDVVTFSGDPPPEAPRTASWVQGPVPAQPGL